MVARRAGAVLLAIMLGAGLAACGDDGGSADDAVDQVDREDTGSDDGDDGNTDDGSDDGSDDGNSDDGDDGNTDDGEDIDFPDSIFSSEECEEVFEAFAAFGGVFSGTGSANFGDLADSFDALAESAPEIADDLELMAEVYRSFGEAVGDDADFSDPSTFLDPAIAEAANEFSSPEFNEASQNVQDFMNEACTPVG